MSLKPFEILLLRGCFVVTYYVCSITRISIYFFCLETCPTLKPVNVGLSCFYGESRESISCNESMINGTIVVSKCKPFHVDEKPIETREMICQENGQWNQELYKCIPGKNGNFRRIESQLY